ncbi:hypothetical protein D6856_07700 [Butyrivibrio sp. XB500-5]|uniref:hypothetical protein n=1 Tax=Butyrivibrio sp. XB500-5 TaxID=2364880 RepID=UPI000EA91899|nr:hypothetical protein [Butyrivibrio sp. XB500-5]RKM60923.1 hypothetical protein D6856_07700 [Butyrivibrio sp. XB500-5]
MARRKEIRYHKPYMGALSGRIGRSIIETILSTPKSDLTELHKRAEECRRAMLAEEENEK